MTIAKIVAVQILDILTYLTGRKNIKKNIILTFKLFYNGREKYKGRNTFL